MTSFKHIRIPQDAFLDEGLAGRITHMYMGHADIRIIHIQDAYVCFTYIICLYLYVFVCIFVCFCIYLYLYIYIFM